MKRSINELELWGKKVLLRLDLNVPLDKKTGEISDEQAQEIVSSSNINPLRMQYLYSVVAPKAFVEMAKNSGNGYTNEQLNSFLVFIRENDLDMQFSNMVMDFLMSGFTQDKENQDKPKIKMTLS